MQSQVNGQPFILDRVHGCVCVCVFGFSFWLVLKGNQFLGHAKLAWQPKLLALKDLVSTFMDPPIEQRTNKENRAFGVHIGQQGISVPPSNFLPEKAIIENPTAGSTGYGFCKNQRSLPDLRQPRSAPGFWSTNEKPILQIHSELLQDVHLHMVPDFERIEAGREIALVCV